MYRVGIIGLGFIGCEAPDNHLKAYQECPDMELIAFCDKDRNKLPTNLFLPLYYTYNDYMKMVKGQNLDIVSVCTPAETHCQIVCDIAPYVKAIYCEKPIALTLEDADKMIKTCHKHSVILQINHQRRFITPKFRFSRGIIHTGTHAFDLLTQLFGRFSCFDANGKRALFGHTLVEIEYVDTDKHIFELDCVRSKEPMILKGVQELIDCIRNKHESMSSGETAREALRLCLEFQKLNGGKA